MRKKSFLLLAFMFIGFAGFAQDSYLRFTIDGKKYEFTNNVLRSAFKDKKEGGEKYSELRLSSGFVNINAQTMMVELNFLTTYGTRPVAGKQNISNNIGFRTGLPLAYFKVDLHVVNQFKHYHTNTPEDGDLEITSVKDNVVEGTFSLTLFELTAKDKLVLKKGSFRITLKE